MLEGGPYTMIVSLVSFMFYLVMNMPRPSSHKCTPLKSCFYFDGSIIPKFP